jgi:hypothetical protein
VAVAGDDLGRNRLDAKPHGLGDVLFHTRIDLREGADRTGNGAGRDLLARGDKSFACAREFRISLRQLEAEGGRLGMDAVRAADGRRVFVLKSAALESGEQGVHVRDQDIGGAHKLHVEAGVEHVRGGHAGMHEARFRSDDFRNMGEEGNDVVLDLRLDGVDARDIEGGVLALFPDRLGGFLRDDAEAGHGVGRMRLDLEPNAEARLRRPNRRHLGPGITRDGHAASPRASAAAWRMAVMLDL